MFIGSRQFDFTGRGRRVHVMGILNVTPDSFSDGGRFLDPHKALDQALRMQEEGADFIDIGAESTRPGARDVSEEEELGRLAPVLKILSPRLKIPISIDTRKPGVAEAAFREGAVLLNDVSALESPGMVESVVRHGVPVILMHKKGEPATMQVDPGYDDVLAEVGSYLEGRIRFAVERGVDREKILIDPGLGFGKRLEDNVAILQHLPTFESLKAPVVVGASRKSFLRKIFGEDDASILAGSVAASVLAAVRGASILRVHDVAATQAAIRLAVGEAIP